MIEALYNTVVVQPIELEETMHMATLLSPI
jgi:hypothetical protein